MRSGDEFMQKRGSCMSTAHLSEKSVFAEGMACNSKPSTSIFKKHIGRFSSLLMKSEMGYAGVFSLPPPLSPGEPDIGRHGIVRDMCGRVPRTRLPVTNNKTAYLGAFSLTLHI